MINLIIFGITGDLAEKKLLPALFNLAKQKKLPKNLKIMGYSRRDFTQEEFTKLLQSKFKEKEMGKFVSKIEFTKDIAQPNSLYYLAIPPDTYKSVLLQIPKRGSKIMIEKPFGSSLATAKALDKFISQKFSESQIYRVDHYLGKNVIKEMERWKNGNLPAGEAGIKKKIERIEIDIWEKEKVKGRVDFYDKTGAVRDVGQNHMLALLTVLMGSLKNLRVAPGGERAQYKGYLPKNSKTETYFKIPATLGKTQVLLTGGKGLKENKTEVRVFLEGSEKPIVFKIEKGGYGQIFLAAFAGNKKLFPNREQIFDQWKFTDKALAILKQKPLRQVS